jgi:signal transduction histidine kinase
VTVIDSGIGIEPGDVPRLFEPFFTRKGEGEGTGLGLAVVEGIVREHKGWIVVHSERGRGSRFEVFLPRVAPESAIEGSTTFPPHR